MRRNRKHQLVLFWSSVDHSKEHHNERKNLLGFEVTVVDPEPAISVLHDTNASGEIDFPLWMRIKPATRDRRNSTMSDAN
jgi:hypothetical protein